jgi:hypothetical protein
MIAKMTATLEVLVQRRAATPELVAAVLAKVGT